MENKKEKNKNGKMTLERLARMMADNFGEAKTELKALEQRMTTGFEAVDERLDRVEQRLGKVEYRVEEVHDILVSEEKQVLNLQKRVGVLEKTVRTTGK
ncbi:MAG: hypothetical protein Q8R34_00105 [bacterium]|nr:hypothetical protein [bacterium]